MSCGFDREIIQKYADNTIDPLEFIFLKEHINYCGECRKELDMVMTLESQLNKLFDDDSGARDLDLMIPKLVDDCMYEVNKREKVKYAISKGIEMGSGIMGNSLRFIGHIPGSKLMSKGVRKTAAITGNLVVSIVRKKVRKLIANAR